MKKVLIGVLVLVALALAFVASRPGRFEVQRSTTIAAAPGTVHAILADFHQWDRWSPWERMDPEMKKDFGGPERGTGATYHWVGNDKVGEGRMTITGSEPPAKLDIRLDFVKPFASSSDVHFTLVPDGGGTRVTWSMDGTSNFVFKAISIFTSPDRMIGPDFERGLASLKSVAEAEPPPAPSDSSAIPVPSS